ncbi:MAG: RNA methyltransferase [Actinomycetaceae bacterium]|nr:RNA methyltransferase [Actinomycetaceae bacterium]
MPRDHMNTLTGQLKKVIGLYQANNRDKYGQLIIEGPQSVRELLKYAPQLIRDVYVTAQALAANPDIDQLLLDADPYTHIVPTDVLTRVTTTAQGMLAVITAPAQLDLATVLGGARLVVYALEISDPGNLGTIIRAADAAGADGVICGPGSVTPTHPKVIRSTAGSYFHLPVIKISDEKTAIEQAKDAGFQILAADAGAIVSLPDLLGHAMQTKSAVTEHEAGISHLGEGAFVDLTRATMWLVGHEARGFSTEQRQAADHIVSIPLWGAAESLNVAMAATLCLYASATAQRFQDESPRTLAGNE